MHPITKRISGLLLLSFCLALAALPTRAQTRTEEIASQTKVAAQAAVEKVQDAGTAAAEEARNIWGRISESRLKNRTFDELLAWIIIGVMVGGIAGMFTSLKPTGAGKAGRLALGLAGAFVGGMVVRVMRIDFGWGPVLIRYEEVLFSIIGAVLLMVLVRIVGWQLKKSAVK